jgi:hypothetical protein
MFWISVGLFCLGVVCGATLRLMIFIGVLLGAAAIAVVATAAHGVGGALLTMLLTVVVLQIGYAAGFILRAASRSFFPGSSESRPERRAVAAPFGEKRR